MWNKRNFSVTCLFRYFTCTNEIRFYSVVASVVNRCQFFFKFWLKKRGLDCHRSKHTNHPRLTQKKCNSRESIYIQLRIRCLSNWSMEDLYYYWFELVRFIYFDEHLKSFWKVHNFKIKSIESITDASMFIQNSYYNTHNLILWSNGFLDSKIDILFRMEMTHNFIECIMLK
jgi:hypothetical protein